MVELRWNLVSIINNKTLPETTYGFHPPNGLTWTFRLSVCYHENQLSMCAAIIMRGASCYHEPQNGHIFQCGSRSRLIASHSHECGLRVHSPLSFLVNVSINCSVWASIVSSFFPIYLINGAKWSPPAFFDYPLLYKSITAPVFTPHRPPRIGLVHYLLTSNSAIINFP